MAELLMLRWVVSVCVDMNEFTWSSAAVLLVEHTGLESVAE